MRYKYLYIIAALLVPELVTSQSVDSISRPIIIPPHWAIWPMPSLHGISFGSDSVGFTIDTISEPKSDHSKPWYFEVEPNGRVLSFWYEIAACQHLDHRNYFSRIRWYLVNQESFSWNFWGYTIPEDDGSFSIYLALPVSTHKDLVQHEMTHVLLVINHHPLGHPPEYFTRCGLSIHG